MSFLKNIYIYLKKNNPTFWFKMLALINFILLIILLPYKLIANIYQLAQFML